MCDSSCVLLGISRTAIGQACLGTYHLIKQPHMSPDWATCAHLLLHKANVGIQLWTALQASHAQVGGRLTGGKKEIALAVSIQ